MQSFCLDLSINKVVLWTIRGIYFSFLLVCKLFERVLSHKFILFQSLKISINSKKNLSVDNNWTWYCWGEKRFYEKKEFECGTWIERGIAEVLNCSCYRTFSTCWFYLLSVSDLLCSLVIEEFVSFIILFINRNW